MSHASAPTTEPRESSKLTGQTSQTLSLTPLSRETQMEVGAQDPATVSAKIKHLVSEFKGLYEQRLRCLERDTTGNQEILLQVSTCRLVIR